MRSASRLPTLAAPGRTPESVQPAAVGESVHLPAQRLRLAPHFDRQTQHRSDLLDRYRPGRLGNDRQDAPVLLRKHLGTESAGSTERIPPNPRFDLLSQVQRKPASQARGAARSAHVVSVPWSKRSRPFRRLERCGVRELSRVVYVVLHHDALPQFLNETLSHDLSGKVRADHVYAGQTAVLGCRWRRVNLP